MLSIGNVFPRITVDIFLGQAKVDDMQEMLLPGGASADQEIFRLNVPVNQMFRVDVLHPSELQSQHI